MSRFQQRHYNEVAALLSRAWTRAHDPENQEVFKHTEQATIERLVTDFSAMFKADNERFKPELFARVALTNIDDIKRKLEQGRNKA